MAKLLRGIAALLAALSLTVPASAQFRAVEVAPVGGLSVPLTPFSVTAPASLPLESALTPSLAPSLAPSFVPSFAPNIAPALAVSVPEGRAFFDGAAATPERPADIPPAVAPRGETVSLNGVSLPARIFNDKGSIADQLVRAIDSSRVSIDIAIHGLALREIAAALVRAKKRGVRVRIVMNQTHVWPEKQRDTRTPEVQQLIDLGFEMKMLRGADQFGVMHNKIAIFDGQILETGSFNWTHAAETWHWENAMFHAEQARVAAYQAYWNWMWSVSSNIGKRAPAPYVPPAENDPNPHPGLPPAPQDPARPVHFNGELFPGQAFSPLGVTEHLVRAIDLSRKSVDLANFSFTSEALRDALLRAKERGVKVRIVFDAQQYKYLSEMHWFADNGFDILLVAGRAGDRGVMHNKFAIFDGALVEAGSFNWTRNGEKNNYENSMFLDAPDDVAGYLAYYERIRARAWEPGPEDHSEPRHAPEDVNLGH
jgi:phosphatidylserine/phosphatidylglycerophosphate/cardiolipin synthase-like enzyme